MKKLILVLFLVWSSNLIYSQGAKKKSNVKTNSIQYSEEKALELIADYYEFYNADESYDNPVVRRVSNNTFYVKVEFCNGGEEICFKNDYDNEKVKNDFFWNSKVLILKIQSSTKYNVSIKY